MDQTFNEISQSTDTRYVKHIRGVVIFEIIANEID